MTLGFSVDELLPKARGGGVLKMGLAKLDESAWLQPDPDFAARADGFAAYPQGIQLSSEVEEPAAELAAMLGLSGALRSLRRPVAVARVGAAIDEPCEPTEIVGPLCTPLDRLASGAELPRNLAVGDLIAFANCGA